jgi:primosomal protein N' (replication factor Y)
MRRLGLVVVDEEQDGSYKQQEPAPRYNARDAAIVLAGLHGGGEERGLHGVEKAEGGNGRMDNKRGGGAKVILSSATPSLETWVNSGAGNGGTGGAKYGFAELAERYGGTPKPGVIISDTRRALRRGERKLHFNKELSDRIATALERGGQVLIFHNYWSFGTEKIADELATLFPSARIGRLDDTVAGSERAFGRIIGAFERGETDILVGTRMATKGLDFAGVSLVGILNADNLVNNPDFRASERAYQLIVQAAGRAGRSGNGDNDHNNGNNGRNELAGAHRPDPSLRSVSSNNTHGGNARSEVVIQTVSPESHLIGQAATGDFRAVARELLAERAAYGYPPYSRLVSIVLRHADREVLDAAALRFGEILREMFSAAGAAAHTATSIDLLGPVPPATERVRGEYALMFLLKVPRGGKAGGGSGHAKNGNVAPLRSALPMSEVRETLRAATRTLLTDRTFRAVSIEPNVDPQ